MLPKPNRLTKDQDFKKLAGRGKYSNAPQLTIKYLYSNQPETRFGIVVSTKVDKRAVVRNKLQRRLREILRLNLAQIKSGYDIMVIAKKAALELDYQGLEKCLTDLLAKARIYNV